MKSLIINYLSILLCAQAFFACAPDVKKVPERTFRIIHNNDGSDLLGNRWFKYRPLTLADLDSCVDMVANSQVTTYMMCSGSDFFYVRSKYGHVMTIWTERWIVVVIQLSIILSENTTETIRTWKKKGQTWSLTL